MAAARCHTCGEVLTRLMPAPRTPWWLPVCAVCGQPQSAAVLELLAAADGASRLCGLSPTLIIFDDTADPPAPGWEPTDSDRQLLHGLGIASS